MSIGSRSISSLAIAAEPIQVSGGIIGVTDISIRNPSKATVTSVKSSTVSVNLKTISTVVNSTRKTARPSISTNNEAVIQSQRIKLSTYSVIRISKSTALQSYNKIGIIPVNIRGTGKNIVSSIKSSLSTLKLNQISSSIRTVTKLSSVNQVAKQFSSRVQNALRFSTLSILSKAMSLGAIVTSKLSPNGITLYSADKNGNVTGKLSIHNNVVAIKISSVNNYNKVSSTDLLPLLSIRSNVSYTRFSDSNILTLVSVRGGNLSGKATVVNITNVNTASKLLTAIESQKLGTVQLLLQTPVSALTDSEKTAVSALILLLVGRSEVSGVQLSAIIDPCEGSYTDLSVLPITNQLNKDSINFLLCGGEDRFLQEDVDILSSLKSRGLL
jgi:hypothetical protein